MNPKYPIYIPSKGRWDSRLTVRALDEIGVPYHVVVEPQEYDNYAAVMDPARLLILPWSKPDSNTELVPTRNWIWEHAASIGAKWHWQLDDNIKRFWRLNRNKRYPAKTGAVFRAAEDFADRYTNVAQIGFHYFMFAPSREQWPPYVLNTRIYSCTMNLTSLPHRYRGVYNDDTDMSLRLLKEGWCTVLFIAFLAQKMPTMTVKGGNTPIYQGDGRLRMAQSLQEQHPDVTKIIQKWNRWQHYVDYSRFRQCLELDPNVAVEPGVNEYGMVLRDAERKPHARPAFKKAKAKRIIRRIPRIV